MHIADVTHFVKPGSPLDEEAADRSTSTYLVNRRLDMLPVIGKYIVGTKPTHLAILTDENAIVCDRVC